MSIQVISPETDVAKTTEVSPDQTVVSNPSVSKKVSAQVASTQAPVKATAAAALAKKDQEEEARQAQIAEAADQAAETVAEEQVAESGETVEATQTIATVAEEIDASSETLAGVVADAPMMFAQAGAAAAGGAAGGISTAAIVAGVAVVGVAAAASSDSSSTPAATTSSSSSSSSTTTANVISLTQGIDNITGTTGADDIRGYLDGGAATLAALDTINGGDGIDTLTGFGIDLDNVTETNITNVEKLVFSSTAAGSIDLSKMSGVTHLTDINSTAVSTYNNLTPAIELTVAGTSQAHVLNFSSTGLSSAADTVTLNVNNTSSILTITGLSSTNKIETLVINSTGSASTMELNDAGPDDLDFVTTLKIKGSAALDIDAEALSADTTTVDASEMTGNTSIKADAAASTFKFTGGSGNDTLDIGATLAATQTLSGGDGTGDTLVVDSAITTGEMALVTGFEILGVDANAGAFTQDMDFFTTGNRVKILVAGNTITLNDVKDDLIIDANVSLTAAQDIVVNLKDNTAGDNVTLNIGATAGGIALIGLDFDTNYETVVINSQGTAANSIANFGTALNNVTLTGATAITVTSTASLTGVLDAAAMTAALTATTSTTALTVSGSTVADALNTGAVTGATQTINANGGDDVITSGNIAADGVVNANGGAGNDTITFNAANTGASTHNITGGEGFDTITAGQHADTVDTIITAQTATADADRIVGFVSTKDKYDYNGTLLNGTDTTVATNTVEAANLAACIVSDAAATVFSVTDNLAGAADAALVALSAATASNFSTLWTTFAAAYVSAIGGTAITGLDTAVGSGESVLIKVEGSADSLVMRFTNSDTAVANTITAAELTFITVFDGVIVVAADFV